MDLNKVVLHSDFHMNVASEAAASRRNSSTRCRTTRGLISRKGVWHIDKVIYGKRIRESTGTGDLIEAKVLLAHRAFEARRLHLYGRTFREAGTRFVAESGHLRGLERDERALAMLYPFIGALPLQQIHRETLAPFVRARLDKGLSPDTVNRELAMVRRILNLASRVWRDEGGHPWLADAPLIPVRRHLYAREPYPLSVGEQHLLFSELQGHLKTMALFKVNTGLREREVVNLRWAWEVKVPEFDASVFVIPREYVKNTIDRYVVLNRIARSAIDNCRGNHPEFVFTYRGIPVTKIYNSGWKAARRRAAARYELKIGSACPKGFRRIRVHDLKHTYGHRLRGAGVSFEDRQLLLGHKMRAPMTTHYSAADVGALIEGSERVCELVARGSPSMAVVRSCERVAAMECKVTKAVTVDSSRKDRGMYSQLPILVRDEAREFAAACGVSLDQFVAAAVAEKMAALSVPETLKWNTGHWKRPGSMRQE
jgi:integrase